MFNSTPVRHTVNWHNQTLTLETGLLANQASASVLASIGETVVLAAVVLGKPTSQDWLPLQVVYEERMYASGKIKGSRFIKREGRPSENAVLTGRMVDRSIRSLFNKNVRQEVQVVITVLSLDEVNSPDTLAVLAASSALNLCGFTAEESNSDDETIFKGITSAVRIGMVEPSIANLLLQKLESEIDKAESINDIRNTLTEIAHSVDKNIAVEQEGFEKIFTVLGRKNSEWAAKFRIAYQGATQLPRKTALERNKLSTLITVNPNYQELESSILDLVVSGDGQNIVMIEAGAKIIDEDLMIKAMEKANQELSFLENFQAEFIKLAKPKSLTVALKLANPVSKEYWINKKPLLESILFSTTDKTIRNQAIEDVLKVAKEALVYQINKLSDENKVQEFELPDPNLDFWKAYSKDEWFEFFAVNDSHLENIKDLLQSLDIAMEETIAKIVKEVILSQEKRLDGRKIDEIRPITSQVGVLPRTHGSSLFQRGQTQVLNILTLGTNEDAQILDDMEDFEETTKRYIHHYNFPPYSVGETGRYAGPGRREIGHGALAEKALLPVLPSQEEFPYTIRLVSECLGSNGSTSMASTCASTLSLMDAGVPIKGIVAGVAMGLVIDSKTNQFKVITDIQGAEDHYGDMDFKVTGTELGITALQLDNKVAGLSINILKEALEKAKIARIFILNKMVETISMPKKELSVYAPRVQTVLVPLDKIGEVIGPSGKMIKSIIAETGTTIDIDDKTGIVYVYGKDGSKVEHAIKIISSLVKEYLVGDLVSGEVFRMEAYGAFIKIDGTDKEGLIHISQISNDRIGKVQDVLKMGQIVEAKVIEVNEKGQLSLSIKELIKK